MSVGRTVFLTRRWAKGLISNKGLSFSLVIVLFTIRQPAPPGVRGDTERERGGPPSVKPEVTYNFQSDIPSFLSYAIDGTGQSWDSEWGLHRGLHSRT